jgi:predicted DNA-binding transcriptional regulator YafY
VYINCYRARANEYYLEGRKFELPELKLLIDAVESSRFMTESQSKSLTEKLITLTSDTNAGKFKRNLHVPGRVKSENKQIFYIVDSINEAINSGKRISFQYIDYNSRTKEVLRNKGNAYTISPYSLIWNGDYYYLVGYYHEKDDIRTFRVDRIKAQPEILEVAADPVPEDFDITRYTREVFRMYDTEEPVPVTLVCENEVMKGVLDAFGMDIKVKRAEKGHFQTTVMACTSPTFYGWVFQWEGRVRITAPEVVVQAYAALARKVLRE